MMVWLRFHKTFFAVDSMADKRDIRRLKKRLSVRFGVGEAVRLAFTEDLSSTGMFIRTPNVFAPNSIVRIELQTDNGESIVMDARVMWAKKVPHNMFHLVKKSGMGVKIVKFHQGLEEYCRLVDV